MSEGGREWSGLFQRKEEQEHHRLGEEEEEEREGGIRPLMGAGR